MLKDPSLDLMIGKDVSGAGAFMFSKTGKNTAYVWLHDAANIERTGNFNSVETYTDNFEDQFRKIITGYDPQKIALNYSTSSSTADGITYGMFLKLVGHLKDTPYVDRIISAEDLLFILRGRKTRPEIEEIRKAAEVADTCWHEALKIIRPGMTEIQISEILTEEIRAAGYTNSFPSIVNAGAKTVPGHGLPTDAVLEEGDLLHVDFGVIVNGYCSDIQRLAYFKKQNETAAPFELTMAFNKVKEIIDITTALYKPGATGEKIDATARKILTDAGYPEYQHSLGHQLGRAVHDGGSRVGPERNKTDKTHLIPLEENNTFTVELGIAVDKIGYTGIEEDLVVTENGGKFLSPRQTELTVI